MKLNPDCVRDILFYVEDNTGYHKFVEINKIVEALEPKYDSDTIRYHVKQCELNFFFTTITYYLGGNGSIQDLSPKAHEFIANIRNDNNWHKIKEKAKSVGSFSLNALSQIAIAYVSSLIS